MSTGWTINTIQEEFNRVFPYLKLDFFRRQVSGSNLLRWMISPRKTIAECSQVKNEEAITITPGMTVADLGEYFTGHYGLDVRVSRKTGKLWLETSSTNDWTLCRQNKEGEKITQMLDSPQK